MVVAYTLGLFGLVLEYEDFVFRNFWPKIDSVSQS